MYFKTLHRALNGCNVIFSVGMDITGMKDPWKYNTYAFDIVILHKEEEQDLLHFQLVEQLLKNLIIKWVPS